MTNYLTSYTIIHLKVGAQPVKCATDIYISDCLAYALICYCSIVSLHLIEKMRSTLNLITNTPLHKEELTKIKTIWQSLQDHNDSIEFRNPVNYKGTLASTQVPSN